MCNGEKSTRSRKLTRGAVPLPATKTRTDRFYLKGHPSRWGSSTSLSMNVTAVCKAGSRANTAHLRGALGACVWESKAVAAFPLQGREEEEEEPTAWQRPGSGQKAEGGRWAAAVLQRGDGGSELLLSEQRDEPALCLMTHATSRARTEVLSGLDLHANGTHE